MTPEEFIKYISENNQCQIVRDEAYPQYGLQLLFNNGDIIEIGMDDNYGSYHMTFDIISETWKSSEPEPRKINILDLVRNYQID